MKRKGKKAAASNGKHDRVRKSASAGNGTPEWEHLEERFSTLSTDFNQLAAIMDREAEEPEQ